MTRHTVVEFKCPCGVFGGYHWITFEKPSVVVFRASSASGKTRITLPDPGIPIFLPIGEHVGRGFDNRHVVLSSFSLHLCYMPNPCALTQVELNTRAVVVSRNASHFCARSVIDGALVSRLKEINDDIITTVQPASTGVELVIAVAGHSRMMGGRAHVDQKPRLDPRMVQLADPPVKLGEGTFGIVYDCKLNARTGFCVKFPTRDNADEQERLRKEATLGMRVIYTKRCVPVRGLVKKIIPGGTQPRVGMVMPKFDHDFMAFIQQQKATQGTPVTTIWLETFVMWGSHGLVLGILELHALGLPHGDVKWTNVGAILDQEDAATPKIWPFLSYDIRVYDMGLSGEGIDAGTYPFKVTEWTQNPKELLCADIFTDESILLRRSDWFQVLMSAYDLVHLSHLPNMSLYTSCRVGKNGHRDPKLKEVGAEWVKAGRPGGWIEWILKKRVTETPSAVSAFYRSSSKFSTLDRQLTLNFMTCV